MSTRSVIARPVGDGFTGVYHHWDGYPSGVGKSLYELAKEWGVEKLLATLIDQHPAGWSNINDRDWTKAPGFRENYSDLTDLRPTCFCHGARSEEANEVTQDNASEMGCEYAYVICHTGMTIYMARHDDGTRAIGFFGMGDPNAGWSPIAHIAFNEPAPDWRVLDGAN